MKEIFFDTKENNNKRRREEFLALEPGERFMVFLKSTELFSAFTTKAQSAEKNNFVLQKIEAVDFETEVIKFIELAAEQGLRMLMVGGGAVNFHGYQRHSADVDFWLDTSPQNLDKLKEVLDAMGYKFHDFPQKVKSGEQNISIKISPLQELELNTRLNPGKTFDEAYRDSETRNIRRYKLAKYHVLNLEDLITSKIKSGRPKDLLDIEQLKRDK